MPQGGALFTELKAVWRQFLAGTLLPGQVFIPVPRGEEERAGVVPLPVPPLFRALFVREQAEQPYNVLYNRFLTVYVGRYPVGRYTENFGNLDEAGQTRRAHLKALCWLLLVRPFSR